MKSCTCYALRAIDCTCKPAEYGELYTSPTAKQEPMAIQMDVIVVNLVREGINKHRARELAEHFIKHTTPPKQEAKDEPVAWAFFFEDGEASNELFDTREQGEKWLLSDDCLWAGSLKPLYTTPPKRKPLTDEEIGAIAIKSQDGFSPHDDTLRFARAIEAAHGIKGEAK